MGHLKSVHARTQNSTFSPIIKGAVKEIGTYLGKMITKIDDTLVKNNYQFSRGLPAISILGIAAAASLVYLAKDLFEGCRGDDRFFAHYYKDIPEGLKNYLSLKNAKILTLAAIGITGCVLFSSSSAVYFIALPILFPLTLTLLILKSLSSKKEDQGFGGKMTDYQGIDRLNDAMHKGDEGEALKLMDRLCKGDLCGNRGYYNAGGLLVQAAEYGQKEVIKKLATMYKFPESSVAAIQQAMQKKDLETVELLTTHFASSYSYEAILNAMIPRLKKL